MAWQRFAVQLAGHPEPVTVQTNARDWAGVSVDPSGPRALDMTFRVVHSALLRAGVEVPRHYEQFLDALEGIPETLDGDDTAPLDPTNAAP
jgi:hypothetical protein